MEPTINYQCYICPVCFDDHSMERTIDCANKLKEENDKLRKALEIYASGKVWCNLPVTPWQAGFKFFEYENQEGYELARQTLNELYETK